MPQYQVYVKFIDDIGGVTSKTYEGDFADYATAEADWQTNFLPAIQALTGAGVEYYSIAQRYVVNGAPSGSSNVFSRVSASLNGINANIINHTFPSPVPAALSGNALVFGSGTLWDDYVSNFAVGSGWYLSDGEQLQASDFTARGKRIFAPSGKTNLR